MKVKLSVVAAATCMLAISAQAADDLASAFKEGKLDGRIRVHYMSTDWDANDWQSGKANADSRGLALGGSLIYKTAPLYGFSAGAGFYTTQDSHMFTDANNGTSAGYPKNTTASDLFARGTDGHAASTNFGDGYSVLAQSYLQYDIAKSKIKVGRMLMSNPWISPNDTKMIPIAIEGFEAVSNDIDKTTIQIDYADKIKERGMTYFGNMADTGDTPDAIKNYYRTHYTATSASTSGISAPDLAKYGSGGEAPAVKVLGIKNKSIDALEVQAWAMNWPDIINQGMLEANYGLKAGDVGLSFGARYMKQVDEGAGAIITPGSGTSPYSYLGATNASTTGSNATDVNKKGDNDNSVDTYLYAVRATASYGPSKLMLAYSHTGSGGDIIAPWRGFPTDGYTRSMTQTDWNANTKAYKAQFDYDLNTLVQGVSAMLSYSFYNRDETKVPYQACTDRYYNTGDTRQYNFDVKYDVPAVKGLELKSRMMYQHNTVIAATSGLYGTGQATKSEGFGNDTSNHELRLEANYRF